MSPKEGEFQLRAAWPRTFILAGGFDRASAEVALRAGHADLVAFGRPFLANPAFATFYTPGPKGYMEYPAVT